MSAQQGQAILIVVAGVALAALVLLLARRQHLTLRYTLGWLFVASCVVVSSVLTGLVKPLARALDITETGLLLAMASTTLLLITLQLSISVSGLQQLNERLAEAHALLEERVRTLEDRSGADAVADDADRA